MKDKLESYVILHIITIFFKLLIDSLKFYPKGIHFETKFRID